MTSDKYERVMAAIRREIPDRVPWALWGHFPALPFLRYSWEKANRDGEEAAKAHLALLNELDYKMDLLKVTPFYKFMATHWGSTFRFINNNEVVENVDVLVKETKDWKKLWVLDPKKELKEYVRTVSILSHEIGGKIPIIYTIPSPLIQALRHVSKPEQTYKDMKANPDALKDGLETITDTCIDFGKAVIDAGASGVFFGLAGGGDFWEKMSQEQLEEFELYYDEKVLKALKKVPIKLLHICSNEQENPQKNGELMENGWFMKFSVNAINWWDASFTSCKTAKKIYGSKFCIVAGIDQKNILRRGTPRQVEEQVKSSIEAASENGGFILGPGCTLSQDTPIENFDAVAKAVEKYGKNRK